MIETIIQTGLTTLIGQGIGWVVAVILGVVVWMQDKRLSVANAQALELQKATEAAVKEQFEKRLQQLEQVVEAMNRNSTTLAAVQLSVEARSASVNQLVEGFAKLVRDLEVNREMWKSRGDAWQALLEQISSRLEALQRKAGV